MSSSPRAGRLGLGLGVGLVAGRVGIEPVGRLGLGVGGAGGRLGLGIGDEGGRLGLGIVPPAGRLGIELLLGRLGVMPPPDPPIVPAGSFTCSTTRLMTLRGGAALAATARRGVALRLRAEALPALRLDERAFVLLFDPRLVAAVRRFVDAEARFFDAFFLLDLRLFDDRLLDDRLADERFFEDFFEDFEDFRDERFLDAAIWFLLLTRLDWGAES